MPKAKHPMQPIVWVNGNLRFKENAILRWAVDSGKLSLNEIALEAATQGFSKDDQMQLAQLIGYSVSGYGDLPYASKQSVAAADAIAEQMIAAKKP
ncbi:hypothetical protein FJ973_29550 [Mesorhizobium sp. B2-1-3]|uniref:hypothetical protein n=1 Tax=Mesorhizobium sp. B2-1-3 TaxID=2589972 RepID=UPI0011272BFA|nr:hypothetical protein [Mesorhizobium sp. B2-1-3]TPN03791.1 hypothetical protein FJ973_29550 [Mesorhizobium sp. B2-1-3]